MDKFLTPNVRAFLGQIATAPPPDPSPEGQRQALNGAIAMLGAKQPIREAEVVPLSNNGAKVALLRPQTHRSGLLPVIIYLHGGGFVAGGLEGHGSTAQVLADRSGCAVALVDYRLAPEYPFPAALDDCIEAISTVREMCDRFGLDRSRIAAMGDSAGGHLVAATAIALQSTSQQSFALQVLINPMMSPASGTQSLSDYSQGWFASAADFQAGWNAYAPDGDAADPRLNPLAVKSMTGLPPAVIFTNSCDPVRDEGELYAERLAADGVTVNLLRLRGTIHAEWLFSNALPEANLLLSVLAGTVGTVLRSM